MPRSSHNPSTPYHHVDMDAIHCPVRVWAHTQPTFECVPGLLEALQWCRDNPSSFRWPSGPIGANRLVALTEGFQSAFWAVAILAGIGVAFALLLLGRPRRTAQEQLESASVTVGD